MSTSRRKGQPATADDEQAPAVGRWRYIGDVERIYMHVPVTVQHGAVIEHAGPPADDGQWEPADDAEVTHRPDNAPAEEPERPGGEQVDDDQDADAEQQQQFQLEHHDTAGE